MKFFPLRIISVAPRAWWVCSGPEAAIIVPTLPRPGGASDCLRRSRLPVSESLCSCRQRCLRYETGGMPVLRDRQREKFIDIFGAVQVHAA